MKKLKYMALLMIILISCKNDKKVATKRDNYQIMIMDSCEYIMICGGAGVYSYVAMSHKGNCKYCKERYEKNIKIH